ncbi:hypothetical protein C5167_012384 [Papaver somniferum]|uniref:Uncharacterized protein n=1 Tax=Papaver somniferum TaxID=3469 RepID=A0A4Y7J0D8_PAPSO|nr:hypothetical protein C5167_012384 [Papaver somniferum]
MGCRIWKPSQKFEWSQASVGVASASAVGDFGCPPVHARINKSLTKTGTFKTATGGFKTE